MSLLNTSSVSLRLFWAWWQHHWINENLHIFFGKRYSLYQHFWSSNTCLKIVFIPEYFNSPLYPVLNRKLNKLYPEPYMLISTSIGNTSGLDYGVGLLCTKMSQMCFFLLFPLDWDINQPWQDPSIIFSTVLCSGIWVCICIFVHIYTNDESP